MAKFDLRVDGLNDVLRAMRALPKEAQTELRESSNTIADRYMAPAWRNAALFAGPWGPAISDSVRVKKDRLPSVQIGGNRAVFSGGASATMVRYPSDKGNRGRAGKSVRNAVAAFGSGTDWMDLVRGTYQVQAFREWAQAVDRIVKKWDRL